MRKTWDQKLIMMLCVFVLWGMLHGQTGTMADKISEYSEDRSVLRRTYDLPFCSSYHMRWNLFYESWEKWLDSVAYDNLSADDRIDYHLFRNHLHHESLERKKIQEDERILKSKFPFAKLIIRLELRRRSGKLSEWAAVADTLESIASSVGGALQSIESERSTGPRLRAERVMIKRLDSILANIPTCL